MKSMLISLFIAAFFTQVSTPVKAQISDYYDQRTCFNAIVYYSIQTRNATSDLISTDQRYGFPSFGWEIEKINDGAGALRTTWRYRMANDVYSEVLRLIGVPIKSIGWGGITSGLLGEFGMGWNVFSQDDKNAHLGFVAGDYILFTGSRTDGLQGWYWSIGPKLGYDMELGDKFCLQVSATGMYGVPETKGLREEQETPAPGHYNARPFLITLRTELMARKNFFIAADYIRPITKHPTKLTRMDLILGVKL